MIVAHFDYKNTSWHVVNQLKQLLLSWKENVFEIFHFYYLNVMLLFLSSPQKNSCPKLFPGDIVEYPRNKYFSHFAVYYGERDSVPYVAHLTFRGRSYFSSVFIFINTIHRYRQCEKQVAVPLLRKTEAFP